MPRPRQLLMRRILFTCGAIALATAPSWVRGAAAAPAAPAATVVDEVHSLGLRLEVLERRIVELEDANARLERAVSTSPSKVQAPFIVVDAQGKTLVTIDRSPKHNGPRLTVGDSVGSAAVFTAGPMGGSIQLIEPGNKVRVAAIGSTTGASLFVAARSGRSTLGSGADGLPFIHITNLGDIPVAELKQTTASNGLLTLTNEAGDIVVEAGTSTKGVGVVKAGPGGNGAAAQLGNAGRAASEIQGQKP